MNAANKILGIVWGQAEGDKALLFRKVRPLFVMGFLCLMFVSPVEAQIRLHLVAEGRESETSDHFECSEKIRAYIRIGDFPRLPQNVCVQWIRPDRVIQEETKIFVKPHVNSEDEIYAWLKIKEDDSVLGDFGFGAYGEQGPRLFDGYWQVVVIADEKEALRETFQVSCLK